MATIVFAFIIAITLSASVYQVRVFGLPHVLNGKEIRNISHFHERVDEGGRKRVEGTFTIEKMTEAVLEVYSEGLHGNIRIL